MIATIAVPSGSAYFEGHFPERPILPGVAQLALVLETLARESSRPAALRAIPYARLRQLVVPGDRLQLTAREEDGGSVRVEVKCDGRLVANGELKLGRTDETCDVVASSRDPLRLAFEAPPLDALLPHRPPMRFVTAIVAESQDGLTCAARVPTACALVSRGSAPALAAVEAAAQTAAVWEAVRRWRAQGAAGPRIGYLVALRDVVFFVERIPADETVLASLRLETAAPRLTYYAIEVSLDGMPVVRGTIGTFLAEAQ